VRAFALVFLLTLLPGSTSAATIDQIIALSKAGVSDSVIVSLIERDQVVYPLTSDDLVRLKTEGVTDQVVLAMMKSGRAEAEAAEAAESARRAAAADTTAIGPIPLVQNEVRPALAAPVSAAGEVAAQPTVIVVPYAFPIPSAARVRSARRAAVNPVAPALAPHVVPCVAPVQVRRPPPDVGFFSVCPGR
jgi:hypothetical protein